jgi:hypothetical protein
MLLALFALIDFAAGISLIFPNPLGFFIGSLSAIKGLTSFVGGLGAGENIILIMGIIDILTGIMLVFNFSLAYFWLIVLAKATYSLVFSFGSS